MNVRAAIPNDIDFVVRSNVALARESEGVALDEPTVRRGVEEVLAGRRGGGYRLLEIDGGLVAQLMITHEWSDWRNCDVWWLQSVWVEPEHRGRGCCRALYEQVLAEAKRAGAGGLRLYVDRRNERAQAVYEALGMDGEHYRVYEAMLA